MEILPQREQFAALRRDAMPSVDAWDKGLSDHARDADQEHLGPWYHGSDWPMEPGTTLTPGGGRSQWSDFYDGDGGGRSNRRNWVWVAKTPEEAQRWGSSVYEVQPHDEGPHPWNGTGEEGHVTPRATILNRVNMGKRRFERIQQEKARERSADDDRAFSAAVYGPSDGLRFTPFEQGDSVSRDVARHLGYPPGTTWPGPGLAAHDGHDYAGHIEWHTPETAREFDGVPDQVSFIHVRPEYRRSGIATELFDQAKADKPDLEHSEDRSYLGDKWVEHERGRHAAWHFGYGEAEQMEDVTDIPDNSGGVSEGEDLEPQWYMMSDE